MDTYWDDARMTQYTNRRLAELASVRPREAAELATSYQNARTAEEQMAAGFAIENAANRAAGDMWKAADRNRGARR